MNQTQFRDLCQATAYALQAESLVEDDSRCSLSVNGIDMLIDLDEADDMLHCYVDLGNPSPSDRAKVCEQLLELNLQGPHALDGSYAFDPGSGRAIFRAQLTESRFLAEEELAEALSLLAEETEAARHLVTDPRTHIDVPPGQGHGGLFTGALA